MRTGNLKRNGNTAAALLLLAAGGALTLTGCGTGVGSTAAAGSGTQGAAKLGIHGTVHGGQQPIYNATVQLYAMGTSGNQSAASPLIQNPPTSNAAGVFNITGDYTCPSPSPQVYLVATGGDPQIGASEYNTAIALMADLGDCATLVQNAANLNLVVNEISTVGAIYALAPFISDYANVGYAPGNLTGALNSQTMQNVLINLGNGVAPGEAVTGVTIPSARLNTFANILATCINSTGSTSTGCTTLFSAAGVGSGHQNTIAAMAALAHAPATSTTNAFNNILIQAPFQPMLTTAPADWTVPVIYSGGGLSSPAGVAVDATGAVWVANQGGNAITKLVGGNFASGTSGFTSTQFTGPQAVAIDASGNPWIGNTGANNVLELNPSTGAIANTYTANINGPSSLAFDGSGNLWVANFNSSTVAEFTPAGSAVGSGFTSGSLTAPTGIAVDASNNVWVTSSGGGVISTFNQSGTNTGNYTDGLLIAPGGVVTDSGHSRVWTAATGINAIVGLTGGGAVAPSDPLSIGISLPLAVALDSAGNVWTANSVTAGSVSGFTTNGVAISSAAGLGTLNQPAGLAVDASGSLWVTDMGDNTVTQFVGLASSAVVPLVSSAR